jgi:hypothetical protein
MVTILPMTISNAKVMNTLLSTKVWSQCVAVLVNFKRISGLVPTGCSERKLCDRIQFNTLAYFCGAFRWLHLIDSFWLLYWLLGATTYFLLLNIRSRYFFRHGLFFLFSWRVDKVLILFFQKSIELNLVKTLTHYMLCSRFLKTVSSLGLWYGFCYLLVIRVGTSLLSSQVS